MATAAPAVQRPPVHVSGFGRVVYLDFEGGFYGILGDNGTCYDPVNLPGEYQVDGLRISFNATVLPEQASFHQWGTVVTIDDISGVQEKKTDMSMTLVIVIVPAVFICALVGRVLWLRQKSKPPKNGM